MAAAKKAAAPRVPLTEKARVPAEGGGAVRTKLNGHPGGASSYFTSGKEGIEFVSSGSAVMNEALGGGWALGRVSNVVGDRSAGKTLLAIEGIASFHAKYLDGHSRYAEAEAAFDQNYAEALGMPIDKVEFNRGGVAMRTIEELHKDIERVMKENKGRPIFYVIDSLDSLSDEAEQERDIDEKNTYGTQKAKKLGEMFRRLVQDIEEARMHLMVVSQLRDKIGVTFGETKTRSGGKALDYYASHIVWLREKGKLKRTIAGVERVTGIDVEASVRKNKVGLPFRKASYPILFGYGIDDLTANVEWLLEVGKEERLSKELDISKAGYKARLLKLRDRGGDEVREFRETVTRIVQEEWRAIDTAFLPKSRKY